MRSISHKESEIDDKEAEIFHLKHTLEEKEKNIIRLLKSAKEKDNGSNGSRNEEQEFKIIVNSPKTVLRP
jgi:hypothetical protein